MRNGRVRRVRVGVRVRVRVRDFVRRQTKLSRL
jgi:hypothetical protein